MKKLNVMKLEILLFGILADIIGDRTLVLDVEHGTNVHTLRETLALNYPKLSKFRTYSIAVNMEYVTDEVELNIGDTVALIPPVSGG